MASKRKSGPSRRDVMAAAPVIAATTAASGTVVAQVAPPPAKSALPASSPPHSAASAARAVESVRDPILRISREVWANAERSFSEVKSAAIHVRELRAAGFRITGDAAGVPTAFVAEWSQGTGGPKIGFMPEYDALPGLGNAADPRPMPGPTGVEVGHGCGHNMLGAGCTGGAIALKRMMEQDGTAGTIRVYGCAAEEGGAVKVYMVRAGLFDDLDAALSWHPAPLAGTGAISTAASNGMRIKFHGRTAHAGLEPWRGRSALKAAEIFGIGIQFMREHVEPTVRMHYIYESTGIVTNVVPEFTQVVLTIRDKSRGNVVALTEWAKTIAESAAAMTQTRAEFNVYVGYHPLLPNDTLIRAIHRHMSATPIEWTVEEQAFARSIQKEMKLPEKGLATRVLPVLGEITTGAGTDVGDVSFVTPTGVFGWPTLPVGVALHTWGVTACGGMSIGDKASIATAKILAGIGYDLMTDSQLRQSAKADLARRRGDYKYVSPLPGEQRVPPGIPDHLLKATGEDEIV